MAQKRNIPERAAESESLDHKPVKKRKREYTEADAALAQTFEQLSSEIEKDRIRAAADIVNLYKTSNLSSERILLRLIRGLCSSRKAARPGFFIALVEVVKATEQQPELLSQQNFGDALKVILEKIKSETKIEGSVSAQEKRDYQLGTLTGYSAIVHSAALLNDGINASYLDSILQEVWEIGEQSSQLIEQRGKLYYDVVTVAIRHAEKEPIERVLQLLKSQNMLRTPEGIAVWIEAANCKLEIRFPKHIWHNKDPLCSKELPAVAKIMKGGNDQDNSAERLEPEKRNLGTRRDAPHFAWHTIFTHYFEGDERTAHGKNDESKMKSFQRLWTMVVDDVYFESTASPERKALGLRLFSTVVSTGPVWACCMAFGPKMINCLLNQRNKDDRFLHQAATSILNTLKARAISDTKLASSVLGAILTNRMGDIERLSRSKSFIKELFEEANDDVARHIMFAYGGILCKPSFVDKNEVAAARRIVADIMVSYARLRKRPLIIKSATKCNWRKDGLYFMMRCSLLASSLELDDGVTTPCVPAIDEPSRDAMKTRLLSYLKEMLNSQSKEDLDDIVLEVRQLTSYGLNNILDLADDAERREAVKNGLIVLDDILEKEADEDRSDAAQLGAFKLLFSMTILQACSGEADAVPVLGELEECYEGFKNRAASEPAGFDEIVEILTGFCSKPSALYRTLSEQAFAAFASNVSTASLDSLIHVLEQDENLAGQRELFDQQEEDDKATAKANGTKNVNGDSALELDSDDSDVEVLDAPAEEDSSESDESASDDGSDDSSEAEDEVNDADEALNRSLGEILQTKPADGAEDDDSSSSDESMDDEQMEALGIDDQLSAIFAQRKAGSSAKGKISEKKREQKDAKQNMLNFKNRVLDLLAIYVKQQHDVPTALNLIAPLLRLVGWTRSPQLAKKSSDLLETYFKAAKSKGMPLAASKDEIWEILKDVHDEALVFPSKMHANACSKCSLFLARLLMLKKDDSAVMTELIRLYGKTHASRLETGSKTPAAFWTDFVNWSMSMGSDK